MPVTVLRIALVVLALARAALASGWEVIHDGNYLRVERRDYRDSALDEIRGTVWVRASLNAVVALLKDDEFNHEWVHRSGGARAGKR